MKNYIIYEITNKLDNKKYIGCHITENINDNYMGSGKYLKNAIKKHGIENFEKKILYYCDNEIDMLRKEKEIVNEDIVNSDDYYNLSIGGNSWYHINNNPLTSCINKLMLRGIDGKVIKVDKNDKKYKNDNFISHLKNRTIYKDKEGNIYHTTTDDYRIKTGELVAINKGLILVKDKNDKVYLVDKDDDRYKNEELKPFWTNRKHTNETKEKIGSKNSITQKGEKNSQYGSCWIILENEKKCIKINKNELNDYLSKGWIKGRKMNW